MKKKEANKLLIKAIYLLDQTITLKNPTSIPPFQEEQYLVESFGAAKVYFSNNPSNYWYELWANLKSTKTGKIHKMFLDKLTAIFKKELIITSE